MPTKPHQIAGENYVLPTEYHDETHLDNIHAVYHIAGEQAMLATGLKQGSIVADIGCGSGNVAMWLAQTVGADGRVDAVDVDASQLTIAKARAARCARKINFYKQSVYSLNLPANTYDLVFSRFMLCQLQRPYDALQQMTKLVKPGGHLVIIDIDMSSIFTIPASDIYTEIIDLCMQGAQARGVNYQAGLLLPELFTNAGLTNLQLKLHQPIYKTGICKQLWEQTFRNAGPALVAHGIATQQKLDALFRRMSRFAHDETTWIAQARTTTVTGRKSPLLR